MNHKSACNHLNNQSNTENHRCLLTKPINRVLKACVLYYACEILTHKPII